MGTRLARAAFGVIAVALVPLVAYRLAVDATNHGFGWKGFLLALVGVPLVATPVVGVAFGRGRRDLAVGATGAVLGTIVLVVVVVLVALDSR